MKDIEFMDRMLEKFDEDIKDYEKEETTRPDLNPNKLIKKFQKWEKFLIAENENRKDQFDDSLLEQKSKIQDGNNKYSLFIYSFQNFKFSDINILRFAKGRGYLFTRSSE